LHEPHVVPIHQCGEIDGQLYIDMRLIDGTDLDTALAQEGPLAPARAVAVVRQVASALNAAHAAGLIHRDVKPANILLGADDFACLVDFGLANAASDAKLTSTGFTVGTFAYMAPERLSAGGEIDRRVDVYALACVLYECLTGSQPYSGDIPALISAHITAPIPRPTEHRPGIPATFDDVIARGMAKNAGDRYATTIELADAARDAITEPIHRPAPTPPTLPATEQAPLSPTQRVGNRATAKPVPPPQPIRPTPTRAGGIIRRITIALIVGAVALVAVIAAAVGIPALVKHRPSQSSPTAPSESSPTASERSTGDTVRVMSSKLVTQPGTSNPKAVVSFYEDFLCPACGNFERTFGPTVSNLIDIGAIAADYSTVSILDNSRNQNYSSRAGAAALCVADESMDAFRRFHAGLFSTNIQPSETGTSFPDNAKLIELAREAGVVGTVPDCVNSGKYLSKVAGEAAAANITAAPTIKINGDDYEPSTLDALVAKIKDIVGNVPGIDSAATPVRP
jgi:serine/threonine protein kinase